MSAHGLFKRLEIIARNLMTESTRAAVDHHHNLIVAGDPERSSRLHVEDSVVRDHLHLKIMIPGAQRPELTMATLNRPIAHVRWIGVSDTPALLDPFQILRPSIPVFDTPLRAFAHDVIEVTPVEPHRAFRADTGRHLPK